MKHASLRKLNRLIGLGIVILGWSTLLWGQTVVVTGKVVRPEQKSKDKVQGNSSAVVWLLPLGDEAEQNATGSKKSVHAQLMQKGKRFKPHLLVIPAGTLVDFPNQDPFFHNVFSLFNG